MNGAELSRMAMAAVPGGFKGTVTFRNAAGATTTATATAAPARAPGDGFQADATIREKARRLMVLPNGLAFTPTSGMYASWEGHDWNVISVSTEDPSGSGMPAHYIVTLQK